MSGGQDKAARIQADAQRQAAELQKEATAMSIASQEKMFGQQMEAMKEQEAYNRGITADNRSNFSPYVTAGKGFLNQLVGEQSDPNSILNRSFNEQEMLNDPGYQFRLQQGQNALNSSLAAKGGMLSGAALKAAMNYNQGFASQEYGNAYQRFTNDKNNRFQMLSGLAGMGLNANAGYAGANMQTQGGTQLSNVLGNNAQMMNGIIQNGAQQQASLILGGANAQAQLAAQRGNQTLGFLGGAASGAMAGAAGGAPGMIVGGILGGLSSLL